jgi:Holliday junction resolvase
LIVEVAVKSRRKEKVSLKRCESRLVVEYQESVNGEMFLGIFHIAMDIEWDDIYVSQQSRAHANEESHNTLQFQLLNG